MVNEPIAESFIDDIEAEIGNIDSFRQTLTSMLDALQVGLDVAGLVPGVGFAPDLLNAAISAARQDYTNAGLCLAASIPIIGQGITTAKTSTKIKKAIEITRTSQSPVWKKLDKFRGKTKCTGMRCTPNAGQNLWFFKVENRLLFDCENELKGTEKTG